MDDRLIGTWLLRSHRVENMATGERSMPFGPAPSGVLVIGADGRMTALITPGTAPHADGTAPAPLVAYSGRYRLLPSDRFVTAVDTAWLAAWVGTEQERHYTLSGDQLDLTTPPAAPGGGDATPLIATMTWVREAVVASGGASD